MSVPRSDPAKAIVEAVADIAAAFHRFGRALAEAVDQQASAVAPGPCATVLLRYGSSRRGVSCLLCHGHAGAHKSATGEVWTTTPPIEPVITDDEPMRA